MHHNEDRDTCQECYMTVTPSKDLCITLINTADDSELHRWWHDECWEVGTSALTVQFRSRVDPASTGAIHMVGEVGASSLIFTSNRDPDQKITVLAAKEDAWRMSGIQQSPGTKPPRSDNDFPWLRDAEFDD